MTALSPEISSPSSLRWVERAVLSVRCVLYSLDLTALNLTAPKLSAALQPADADLLRIVDVLGVIVAGAVMRLGVGERIGRRRLLMIGTGAFGCASLLALFAPTVEALIAARALLGLGAATLVPPRRTPPNAAPTSLLDNVPGLD